MSKFLSFIEGIKTLDTTEAFLTVEDKIIVLPHEVETKTKGGLYLPTEATKGMEVTKGTVVSVGTGQMNGQPIPVSVGDEVAYSKFGGTEIEHEGMVFTCIRYTELSLITKKVVPTEEDLK